MANFPTVEDSVSSGSSCLIATCDSILSAKGIINSAKIELVSLSALVSTVGLDPRTSPTKGK